MDSKMNPNTPESNEERAKEAIEERRIEFLFDCYENGIGEMCHKAGDWYFNRKDYTQALQHYKYSCEKHKFGMSCFNYAMLLANGKGGEKNPEQALTMFGEMCATDDKSCMQAAVVAENEGKFTTSASFLKISCDQFKKKDACHKLSTYYITGKTGIDKDMCTAFQFAKKACELESMFGCANLSKMYKKGEGIEKDDEKARHYKKLAKSMEREMKRNILKQEAAGSSRKSYFEWIATGRKKSTETTT